MRTPWLPVTTLLLTVVVTACGTQSASPQGGDEPTTPGALAYVAAEHAGSPDRVSVMKRRDVTSLFSEGGEGAELRYGSDGEYDGDMLVVVVGQGLDPDLLDCDTERNAGADGCEHTDDGMLIWEDLTPEEDPGTLTVIVEKEGATVLVGYAGPTITDDPRQMELPISVDTLFAIAADPRVDATTTAEANAAGEELVSGG
ncbi:hypothetical protein IEQ44_12465 [Nocardioides sp. Y6]|uniref:Lipoprotein n=1 Tax=Nocardioides malaquae TaxID=2773426 RepID=A0ABR9RV47_9ACTN|nr:hypothetical protein [Nocardioides malaquae]MBE7325466.1 hypothetical protein [Nocardioides malaquae]